MELTRGWTVPDRFDVGNLMVQESDGDQRATLFHLACAYVRIIERIERTRDPHELHELEEQRVVSHNQFADALRAAGIHYTDREHVTRMAFRIAKEER